MRTAYPVHLDETLRMSGGLEPPHAFLPLSRRLVRVLSAVVQVPVLPVSNAGHDDSFRGGVAAQLVRHDHTRPTTTSGLQQLAEEPHGGKSVALWLDQNIDDNAVLIYSPPKVMTHAVDVEKDFVEMLFVSGPGTPSPQAIDVLFAELATPAPDRFIGDQHSPCGHHFFNIAKAHAEPKVMPYAF